MKKEIEQMISELLVDEETKEALRLIGKVLMATDKDIRNSVPALVFVTDEERGFLSCGRVISTMVDMTLAVKGSSTFISLVFPKDNESDEKRFFASPQELASTQNRFYGTMLISFEEFDGDDLIDSQSFRNLLAFIESNKRNIHFVFRVTPEFSETDRLVAELRRIINAEQVYLKKPSIDKGYAYVISRLTEQGLLVDEEARNCIRDKTLPDLINRRSYRGYQSLDVFLDRLRLESILLAEDGKQKVNMEVLNSFMNKTSKDESMERDRARRIGFGMGRRG